MAPRNGAGLRNCKQAIIIIIISCSSSSGSTQHLAEFAVGYLPAVTNN